MSEISCSVMEYGHKSKWVTADCKECQCVGVIPICHPVHCSDPGCDYQHNEVLRLSSVSGASCCPVCSKNLPCFYEGEIKQMHNKDIIEINTTYIEDLLSLLCNTMRNGMVMSVKGAIVMMELYNVKTKYVINIFVIQCQQKTIIHVVLHAIQEKVSVCIMGRHTMILKRGKHQFALHVLVKVVLHSAMLQIAHQVKCLKIISRSNLSHLRLDEIVYIECDDISFSIDEKLKRKLGQCCPSCHSLNCVDGEYSYEHGELWRKNSCSHCKCDSGQILCTSEVCDKPKSCPLLIVYFEIKLIIIEIRGISHLVHFAHVHSGKVSCKEAICQEVFCLHHEKKVHLNGKCCPECILDNSICYDIQDSHKARELWQSEKCKINSCDNGVITRYEAECISCPAGYRPEYHSSICCPICVKNICDKTCSQCLKSKPNYCISCKDSSRLLQEGACINNCDRGFYRDANSCQKCHESCSSCFGPYNGHCLSCNHEYVLQYGYCSSQCSDGYYEQSKICYDCHDTCKKCSGPDNNQCTTCKIGTDVILNGRCVAACDDQMYIDSNNSCKSCRKFCIACEMKSSNCILCEKGYLLQNGLCVSSCSTGYFKINDVVCEACHESCTECSGSSVKCTKCNERYVWQNDRCVVQCNDAHYNDKGICEACHNSCLTCSGPSVEQCTSCPVSYVLQSGVCQRKCELGFYARYRKCEACNLVCKSCEIGNKCSSCYDKFKLTNGLCVSETCSKGQYLEIDGSCKDCPPSCANCFLKKGKTLKCIHCKVRLDFIQSDKCVSKCSQSFFLNRRRHCQSPEFTDCTKCAENRFLTSTSTCVERCPPGFVGESGVCIACPKLCKSCHPDGSCTECFGNHKVLELGKCVDACSDQYYLDKSLKCHDCSWHCDSCNGPSENNCTSCLTPMLLQSGSCVSNCEEGFVQVGKDCKKCNPNCKTCNENLECTSCAPPNFLFNNQCRTLCPHGTFPDYKMASCLDCNVGCKRCFSIKDCFECSFGFVLKDGKCLKECPKDSKYIMKKNSCTGPTVALDISLNHVLTVDIGTLTTVPPNILNTSVIETSDLELKLVSVPSSATLTLIESKDMKILMSGSKIKYDHFLKRRLMFQQFKSTHVNGKLELQLNNGFSVSNIIKIPIVLISQHPPVIITNSPLIIFEHTEKAITNNELNIDDFDNIDDVIFSIFSGPKNGKIRVNQNSTNLDFTIEELRVGAVSYKHSSGIEDLINFMVTDGTHHKVISFKIKVIKKHSDSPLILLNEIGYMMFQSSLVLHENLLSADIGDKSKNRILYTFSKSNEGNFIKKLHGSSSVVIQFTQKEIESSLIYFQHTGSKSGMISLQFEVQDIVSSSKALINQSFHIFVISQNMPPYPSQNASFSVVVSTMHSVLISSDALTFFDNEETDDALLYEIVKFLPSSVGYLFNVDNPENKIQTFSQEDIRHMKIFMKPHNLYKNTEASFSFKGAELDKKDLHLGNYFYLHDGLNNANDSLHFYVSDGEKEMKPTVRIEIINVPKDAFIPDTIFDIPFISTIIVDEGSAVILSLDEFEIITDSSSVDVIIAISSQTVHGHLEKMLSSDQYEKFPLGFKFTALDLKKKIIRYVANTEIGLKPVKEILTFEIYEKDVKLGSQEVAVQINPTNNKPPIVIVTSEPMVDEGKYIVIPSDIIQVSDPDTIPSELLVLVDVLPSFGQLENTETGETEIKDFSVQLIINEKILYRNTNHLHKEVVKDSMILHVNDGVSDSFPVQLNISIKLINDESPILVTDKLVVQAPGHNSVIRNTSLYATDADSDDEDLILKLEKAPINGELRRVEAIDDLPSYGMKLSEGEYFSYEDIVQELIVYVHLKISKLTDSIIFSATDGDFTTTKTMEIFVDKSATKGPKLLHNVGLSIQAGTSAYITPEILSATDEDSDDDSLTYTLLNDVEFGSLIFDDRFQISVNAKVTSFSQRDINTMQIKYSHIDGQLVGVTMFRFNLSDSDGTSLTDQKFIITVIDNLLSPEVIVNKKISVKEGSSIKITTSNLNAIDDDSEPANLEYTIIKAPSEGVIYLQEKPALKFTQRDLAAGLITFKHTSLKENVISDEFRFSVSDGKYAVQDTFTIEVIPVNDQLPSVFVNKFKVQEDFSKLISEFELFAEDKDTKPEHIMFTIANHPKHGTVKISSIGSSSEKVSNFTMQHIYDGRIMYQHDGSDSLQDSFSITVSDGQNNHFVYRNIQTSEPVKVNVVIIPVDDGMPVLTVNRPLPYLEQISKSVIRNFISKNELDTIDNDTPRHAIQFAISKPPSHGIIESTLYPGKPTLSFYQSDIDAGRIFYRLTNLAGIVTKDSFVFDVMDSKPNIIRDNVFHIEWSFISFATKFHYVNETGKYIRLKVKKIGNLKQYSVVVCKTKSGSARSVKGGKYEQPDYLSYTSQIQFDAWDEEKSCDVVIKDDDLYEGNEKFTVELSKPTYSIIRTPEVAHVTILDYEDFPVISMDKKVYYMDEKDKFVDIIVTRSGDTTKRMSVLCYTRSGTAKGSKPHGLTSGSDFISRPRNHNSAILFGRNELHRNCKVFIVDDSFQEGEEKFEVIFEIADVAKPVVHIVEIVIKGPNDVPELNFETDSYVVSESMKLLSAVITRSGPDVSQESSVWCSTKQTKLSQAIPNVDYIPTSQQLIFSSGQHRAKCEVRILDDQNNPLLETNKTFNLLLSSSQNSVIGPLHLTMIVIKDSDFPVLQFLESSIYVNETDGRVNVPISRTGDLSVQSSVICFTDQKTANVGTDFEERVRSESSRVFFPPNQSMANCTIRIVDDFSYEPEEFFLLHLTNPNAPASLGFLNSTSVFIKNNEDTPIVYFEKKVYRIFEPSTSEKTKRMVLRIIRGGDNQKRARIRISTRDGSAISGHDYHAKSRNIRFRSGENMKKFEITIIHRKSRTRNKKFRVVVEKQGLVNVILGKTISSSIIILDEPHSGSNILPAPPVVISLLDYGSMDTVTDLKLSAGYPLICVTVCDSKYPQNEDSMKICESLDMNATNIQYRWETAIPLKTNGQIGKFHRITDSTVFASAKHKVLDTMFFSSNFRIRCVAQIVNEDGVGLPMHSNAVTISNSKGICARPVVSGFPDGLNSQKFVVSLKYIDALDQNHPNNLNVHVEIPHEDGMVPLISTSPMNNIRSLLTNPIYRQQHMCSNLGTFIKDSNVTNYGFLSTSGRLDYDVVQSLPYQFDKLIREPISLNLYKHLNLKSCTWKFDAWYHMTELIDICKGSVISDFEVRNKGQSYLTVQVPLYVSYINAMGPVGWSSTDYHTQLEFSFYYDTVLWRSGLKVNSDVGGTLQVLRTGVAKGGKLTIDFKTKAKFRGKYVLNHHTLPEAQSLIKAPRNLNIKFSLALLWSEESLDGPIQVWRATSNYNLKDYSGTYSISLIPCSVNSNQQFEKSEKSLVCTAHQAEHFDIPISFQQISQPVPVMYSLNTEFSVTNDMKSFLSESPNVLPNEVDFKGIFSEGDFVYGKVSWSPEQNLESAYKLVIDKVFLCTGQNGKIPTYDPTGEVYNEGPQYGCIQPSSSLRYRFILLDRHEIQKVDEKFQDISFYANYASDVSEYSHIADESGTDGFSFAVEPLYKDEVGHEWFLQVLYTIGPSDTINKGGFRSKRSVKSLVKNGTNIQFLRLNPRSKHSLWKTWEIAALTSGLLMIFLIVFVILFLVFKRRQVSVPISNHSLARSQSGVAVLEVKLNSHIQAARSAKPTCSFHRNDLRKNERNKDSGTEV
ncbi:Extracellular matrix protein FRAS1 [Nymphon striatum]|nr:Extracellular matrix protein FRAS1 [Nymphon striatum]